MRTSGGGSNHAMQCLYKEQLRGKIHPRSAVDFVALPPLMHCDFISQLTSMLWAIYLPVTSAIGLLQIESGIEQENHGMVYPNYERDDQSRVIAELDSERQTE